MNKEPSKQYDVSIVLVLFLLAIMGLLPRFSSATWGWVASVHPFLGLILAPVAAFKEIIFINHAKKVGADTKTNVRKLALAVIAAAFSSGLAYAAGFGSLFFHQMSVLLTIALEGWLAFSKPDSVSQS